MNYSFGDILLIDFNPTKGKEMNKVRPALVVSSDLVNANSPFLIVAPITSNITKVLSTHLFISRLDVPSKAVFEQLKSIDALRVMKKLGSISTGEKQLIREKIALCFDL